MSDRPQGLRRRLHARLPGAPPVDGDALRARVADCVEGVQLAWSRRDGEALRPFVSDRLLDLQRAQLEDLDQAYRVNRLEDLEVLEIRVRPPEQPEVQRFDAHVSLRRRDWIEDLRTGDVIGGSRDTPRDVDQRWTFVRDGRRWVVDDVEELDEVEPVDSLRVRVLECFDAVQASWARQDVDGFAPYVSSALATQTGQELEGLRRDGQVSRVEDVHVLSVHVDAPADENAQRIEAAIVFRARDWVEALDTGELVGGDRERAVEFRQRWSFARDPARGWVVDAVTPLDAGDSPA